MPSSRVAAIVLGGGVAVGQLGSSAPTTALGPPHFVDETAASGVDHTYTGDFPYSVGGGVAVTDCDGDGRPDLYVAGGSGSAALYRNESPVGGPLRFVKVDDPAADLTGVLGAYPIDVDSDGQSDLVVLRDGENVGSPRDRAGADSNGRTRRGASLVATRSPPRSVRPGRGRRELPTLAFGNYVADADNPDPDHLCADNELIRPTTTVSGDRYDAPIPLTPSWCALSMLFSDWDRSGRRDLRVSNDRHYYSDLSDGQDQLWRIAPGSRPVSIPPTRAGCRSGSRGWASAATTSTVDGYPDAYLTSQGSNVLQSLLAGPSQPTFRDLALKLGVTAQRPSSGGDPLPSTAWHPEFTDVNNDGFIDLFVSKGNVETPARLRDEGPVRPVPRPTRWHVRPGRRGRRDRRLRTRPRRCPRRPGPRWTARSRRGLLRRAGADLAKRRDPDARLSGRSRGHWLDVRPTQPAPNVDAIGAWIEVRIGESVMRREVTVGGGHAGGELGWQHFGLGPGRHRRCAGHMAGRHGRSVAARLC